MGSDPELVIRSRKNRGEPVSAIDVLPNTVTKHKPLRLGSGEIFPDNVNLEMNLPPSSTREQFIENMRAILKEAKQVIGPDYYLSAPASLNYPLPALQNPLAKQFGCEPDYNAWTVEINDMPASAADGTMRTCGGHIHISPHAGHYEFLTEESGWGRIHAIRAMDIVLGVSSVFLDNDPASVLRRNLYGSPGAHRPKEYGVEYRTLSNFWIRHPKLVGWAFDMTGIALQMVNDGVLQKVIDKHGDNAIIEAVKTGEEEKATPIYNDVADYFPSILETNFNVLGLTSSKTKFMPLSQSWNI